MFIYSLILQHPQFIFADFILLCWFWWTEKRMKNNLHCQKTIIWFCLSKCALQPKWSWAVSHNQYYLCLVFFTDYLRLKFKSIPCSLYMYQHFVSSAGTRQWMLQQAMGQQWSTTVQLSFLKKRRYLVTKGQMKMKDLKQNKLVLLYSRLSSPANKNSIQKDFCDNSCYILHPSLLYNSPLSVY